MQGDLIAMALAAFGAATLLPFQSEIVFAAVQLRGETPLALLIGVASLANTAGSTVNYAIGRSIDRLRHRRWFPLTDAQLDRARGWYARWGLWSLLLSWAPFGDALTLVAGAMRCPLWLFVLLVGLAKTARYAALAWLTGRMLG
ncbi:YqaA family protein [Pseudooceanicola aestuarii]|uniref:YqaA family protein n=1 Tax=Pseudooceanicola aestuarii TaxID=2697319 RepID=UPI0013D56538|nr:YqaA family protein [Pseudooceanicola aestuarii]